MLSNPELIQSSSNSRRVIETMLHPGVRRVKVPLLSSLFSVLAVISVLRPTYCDTKYLGRIESIRFVTIDPSVGAHLVFLLSDKLDSVA
jgi:hypothetical protein